MIPTWQARDLLARAAWGEATADWYRVEVAVLEAQLVTAREERPRWWERPAVILPLGFALGAGAVLGGAWAVGEVAR